MVLPVRRRYVATAIVFFSLFATSAWGVDGVIEINQARALAGGVTTGDAAAFPVSINESGSYRLTGSLTPTGADTNVIEINASAVVLDLNGFSILGGTTCTATLFPPNVTTCTAAGSAVIGITGTTLGSVEIKNGSITGMKGALIDLDTATNVQLRDLVGGFSADSTACIRVGVATEIINTRIGFCQGAVIEADSFAKITDSRAGASNGVGFIAGIGSVVRGGQASLNATDGLTCVSGCVLEGNAVTANGSDGIEASTSALTGNAASLNTGYGLNLTGGTYGGNALEGNTTGAVTGTGVSQGTNVCAGAGC